MTFLQKNLFVILNSFLLFFWPLTMIKHMLLFISLKKHII